MSFVIDPRICLVTGREIGPSGHDCCGNDHEFREQSRGLGAVFGEKRKDNALRAQMAKRSASASQSSLIDFTPPGLKPGRQASEYVPPSQSFEFLRPRPVVSTPPRSAAMQIESVPGRRTTFAAMLRRMFGPRAG